MSQKTFTQAAILSLLFLALTMALQAVAEPTTEPDERKIKYWTAPMDPTFISDKPGKSPMGMDLIPVYED